MPIAINTLRWAVTGAADTQHTTLDELADRLSQRRISPHDVLD
jgi:hypothetical protein